jgi:hypothetical protein
LNQINNFLLSYAADLQQLATLLPHDDEDDDGGGVVMAEVGGVVR